MKRAAVVSALVVMSFASAFGSFAQSESGQAAMPTIEQANTALQGGEFEKAADMFKQICEKYPQAGQAWFMQGYALHMAGRLDEALPIHKKAATFPGLRPQALYNVACIHALQGDTDEAFDVLRLSLDEGQTTVQQLTSDTDLSSLHDDPRWDKAVERLKVTRANSPASAMNFWVGEWDCYTPDGKLSGTNHLELVNNDLFVHEQWKDAQGHEGQSFNFYDIKTGLWHQTWVDSSRQLVMTAEPTTPGELVFEGENFDRAGNIDRRRILVRKLDDGRVYQEGKASPDGKEWHVTYRLIYMPKGEPFNGEGIPASGEG